MKVIVLIMAVSLLSFFNMKDYIGYKMVEVLGPEIVDQVGWCAVGLAWWDSHDISWTGDSVKIVASVGSSGSCEKVGVLVYGHFYRVRVEVVNVNGGWFEMPGLNPNLQVNVSGIFSWVACCINGYGKVVVDHSGFTGSVLSLSVREIIGYRQVED